MRRWSQWLSEAVAAEQDRLFLWVPVLYGGGIGLYFMAASEPPLLPLLALAAGAVLLAAFWREGVAALVVGGMLAWLAMGIAAAKVASDLVAAPVIEREMRNVRLTGWVELVEPRSTDGERITVRVASFDVAAPSALKRSFAQRPVMAPKRVRVRIPAGEPSLVPGEAIAFTASLLPPAGPALPGAYDFGRTAWFQGLGAVGFAARRPTPVAIAEPMPLALALWVPVESLRQVMSRRIRAVLPGETGAIAAALITGERGGISEATNTAYRDSGIFHILSISGLHMTVFAGALFFAVRLVLSLFPVLALGFQIKKWAAVTGMAGTFAYLLVSGGSPPAVRSALMIAVMFLAILLDRPALALRNVAVSALLILIAMPQSLIDVGFQMSFAAVVSLIAGIEAWHDWRRHADDGGRPERGGAATQLSAFLGGIVLTTVIATVAVAPFAAFYFHKSTQYGALANLAAIPICNLIAMPAALATLVAMPLGLEAGPLAVMGLSIDAMTWVAYRVAALPGSVIALTEVSSVSFGLMVAGGLWLALWSGRWRLAGVLPVLAGLAMAPVREAPDVVIGANGNLVAVRDKDGRYAALDAGRSRFELGRWLEHDGDPRRPEDVGPGRAFLCDPTGCSARLGPRTLAVARHAAALRDDCRRAALVVWTGTGKAACPGGVRVVTRADIARDGTHIVRMPRDASGVPRIATVAAHRGSRPWSRAVSRDGFDGGWSQ